MVRIWRPAAPRIDAESGCQRLATHISLFLAFFWHFFVIFYAFLATRCKAFVSA